MVEYIVMEPECLGSVITSAIEVYPKEMRGFWINKKGNYRGVDILLPKISRGKRNIRF